MSKDTQNAQEKKLQSNALFISAVDKGTMYYFPVNVKQERHDEQHIRISYEFLSSIVEYDAASRDEHLERVKKTLQETIKLNNMSYLMSLRIFDDGDFYALIVPESDKALYDFQKVAATFAIFLDSIVGTDGISH